MKKNFIKLTTLLLSVLLLFTATACGKDKGKSQPVGYNEGQKYTYQGTHEYNVEETENPFVVNGKTDYVLVVPAKKSAVMLNAMEEFAYFFKMATNININTVNDNELNVTSHQAGTKYISLGKTTLLESTGMTAEYSVLGRDGFRIVTKDTNVYLFGVYDESTRFSVYGFMRIYFNYQPYTVNTWKIDENVKNLNFKKLDVTDIPDFSYRRSTGGSMNTYSGVEYDQINFARRMGIEDHMYPSTMKVCNVDTLEFVGWGETNMVMIPKNGPTGSQHPKWFSNNGNQWCYTAHGDPEELDALVEVVSNTLYESLKYYNPTDYPRMRELAVDIADNRNGCTCDGCVASMNKYGGAHSAAAVQFLNRVAQNVREWFNQPENEQYRREDFHINFLGYLHMTKAPTFYDESTGEYKPYDNSVICDPMLKVVLANIDQDWQQSIFAEDNKWALDIDLGWAAVIDNCKWYIYPENLRCDLSFYDNFCFLDNKEMQFYASIFKGDVGMYYEGGGGQLASSRFANLKAYLNARVMWDTTLDTNELIDDYFDAVYGNAATYMKEFFNAVRAFTYGENTRLELFKNNSVMNYCYSSYNWSEKTLYSWLEYGEKAKGAIANLQVSDPENYHRICENIEMEMIMPIYFLIDQCATINADTKAQLKQRVIDTIEVYPSIKGITTITKGAYQGRWTVGEWIYKV